MTEVMNFDIIILYLFVPNLDPPNDTQFATSRQENFSTWKKMKPQPLSDANMLTVSVEAMV